MAITQCPNCNQEISDKANRCIHCGEILIEENHTQKICVECGKDIHPDVQECPFCGCPAETGKSKSTFSARIVEKIKKNKETLSIVAIIATIVLIVGLIIISISSGLNEDEELAYENAEKMQSMLKDPDSFRLYDEMFLLKHYDENGNNDYTYTIFKYGGTNSYGAIITDEAIFKNKKYIMDYDDDLDKDDDDYLDKLKVKADIAMYLITGENATWEKVEIDVELIKDELGLD